MECNLSSFGKIHLTIGYQKLAIDKAKDSNMPNDNVQRAIQRGTGSLEGVNYEEIRYEGYGFNGAAVIVAVSYTHLTLPTTERV